MFGEDRKAEGGGDRPHFFAFMMDAQRLQFLLHLQGAVDGLILREAGHQQHKLLSSQAEGAILFPQGVVQHAAHGAKYGIARIMAMRIVEPLEMVYVHHQAGQRRLGIFGVGHLFHKHRIEPATVRKAGQRIRHRHLPQRVAKPQIGECQADIFRQHFQIFFGAADLFGCPILGFLDIEQPNAFALRRQRDADCGDLRGRVEMFAGNVDQLAGRLVNLRRSAQQVVGANSWPDSRGASQSHACTIMLRRVS